MHKQFYLIPMESVIELAVESDQSMKSPKYMATQRKKGFNRWAVLPYGDEGVCLCCFDGNDQDHQTLGDYPDVFQFPFDLSLNVSANELGHLRKTVRDYKFTSDWVVAGKSFRGIARNIGRQCCVMQHACHNMHDPVFIKNKLNTPVKKVNNSIRSALGIKRSTGSLGDNLTKLMENEQSPVHLFGVEL